VPGKGTPATRIVGSLTDITERHELEDQLRREALYDSLTGLPNRALFLDRLSQAIARSERQPEYSYAVLWLDLDGFKVLNDSLGHMVGDQLLVQVAKRIRRQLRAGDTAARFGGDEFALLLDALDLASAEDVATRLLKSLRAPHHLEGNEIVVSASMGIATSAGAYDRPEDVLRDADTAMYRAKAAGRNSIAAFDSAMRLDAIARLKTETELRHAIDHGELELHYQPIVQLGTGATVSLEGLVRWRRPDDGLLQPVDFLGVAEESGLIVPLGRWVRAAACRQMAEWDMGGQLPPGLTVSINLSNREFWHPHFMAELDELLEQACFNPERLNLEITEGVIMGSLDDALEVIRELHDRGIRVHIDDFGTGHSSLEALHRLPIEALKIDKGFVARLSHDTKGKTGELVGTMISLGESLGFAVIAEGVETRFQAEFLHNLGCMFGQGFLFSRPVPADEAMALLASRHVVDRARDLGGQPKAGSTTSRASLGQPIGR
ncbi:MAG TPA: EAL domain-containing protein, partial [Acidimicrobiales bacterium]|nr:EAL domain-containing protein [Acidimicrobiales bacterium]